MSEEQAAILRPETLVEEFKKNGVTHVVTIPDSETNYLYELMKDQPWLDVIPAAREGETFAISYGLFIGGKVPVCLIQNTGMLESGENPGLSRNPSRWSAKPHSRSHSRSSGARQTPPRSSGSTSARWIASISWSSSLTANTG